MARGPVAVGRGRWRGRRNADHRFRGIFGRLFLLSRVYKMAERGGVGPPWAFAFEDMYLMDHTYINSIADLLISTGKLRQMSYSSLDPVPFSPVSPSRVLFELALVSRGAHFTRRILNIPCVYVYLFNSLAMSKKMLRRCCWKTTRSTNLATIVSASLPGDGCGADPDARSTRSP